MDSALAAFRSKVSPSATSNFMIGVTAYERHLLRSGRRLPQGRGPRLRFDLGCLPGDEILMRTSNERIRTLFVVVLLVLTAVRCSSPPGDKPSGGNRIAGTTLEDRQHLLRGKNAGLLLLGNRRIRLDGPRHGVGTLLRMISSWSGFRIDVSQSASCCSSRLPVCAHRTDVGGFLAPEDYRFAAISCAVLGIIALGLPPGNDQPAYSVPLNQNRDVQAADLVRGFRVHHT